MKRTKFGIKRFKLMFFFKWHRNSFQSMGINQTYYRLDDLGSIYKTYKFHDPTILVLLCKCLIALKYGIIQLLGTLG